MSDIQRWQPTPPPNFGWTIERSDTGFYVTYSDHLAAIEAAENRLWDIGDKRVRAALDAARDAVAAELGWEDADPSDDYKPHTAIWKFRALAAIDALRKETK